MQPHLVQVRLLKPTILHTHTHTHTHTPQKLCSSSTHTPQFHSACLTKRKGELPRQISEPGLNTTPWAGFSPGLSELEMKKDVVWLGDIVRGGISLYRKMFQEKHTSRIPNRFTILMRGGIALKRPRTAASNWKRARRDPNNKQNHNRYI